AAAAITASRAHQPRRLAPLVAEFSGGGATPALRRAMLSAQTDMLRISVTPLALPASASLDAITAELYTALTYVSARTETTLAGPITVQILADPQCALHGAAYTQSREVHVTTCAAIPPARRQPSRSRICASTGPRFLRRRPSAQRPDLTRRLGNVGRRTLLVRSALFFSSFSQQTCTTATGYRLSWPVGG
ncbi:MAG: hypothetical protein ACK44M_11045, partial [Chloroflexus sp.]